MNTWSDDPRDRATDRTQPIVFDRPTDDGDFEEIELPSKWAVCDLCGGAGKHVNPAIDAHGLSAEDLADDPDFRDDYFGGVYDVPCAQCQGRTTIRVPDFSRCSFALKRAYLERQREEAEYQSMCAAERRMGA